MHFKEKKNTNPQKKEQKKRFSSNFWLFLLHPVSILPCLLLQHTKMFHQSAVVIEEILKLFKIIISYYLK